uniref:Uncharacterized protein n=1 Tax=Plectus sambesii TaxID=2011161 RepID=A0A914XB24_9BILA
MNEAGETAQPTLHTGQGMRGMAGERLGPAHASPCGEDRTEATDRDRARASEREGKRGSRRELSWRERDETNYIIWAGGSIDRCSNSGLRTALRPPSSHFEAARSDPCLVLFCSLLCSSEDGEERERRAAARRDARYALIELSPFAAAGALLLAPPTRLARRLLEETVVPSFCPPPLRCHPRSLKLAALFIRPCSLLNTLGKES